MVNTDSHHGSKLFRPETPPGPPQPSNLHRQCNLSFGVVCSSNINRSMEAHLVFKNAGLIVESYGTGSHVRLPGRSAMEPQVFKFGTPYEKIYENLSATKDDEEFFERNGILKLCRRGSAVKTAPQRWQDTSTELISKHNIVVAFEERIFDAVVEDLQMREPTDAFKPIHVICLDTKDNPQEAERQGQVALELCWLLEHVNSLEDLDNDCAILIDTFQKERMRETNIKVLYQLCYL